ncbi:MAG: serine hydrolase [bacterium]|nr:serine hydrolase [bacterium]
MTSIVNRLARALALAACLAHVASMPPPAQAAPQPQAAPQNSDWPRWETPEEAGFSSQGLAEAERLWSAIDDAPVSAFFLVYKGRPLAAFGDVTADHECHSVRKSFMSALYGPYVADGTIDVEATLEELGIDDDPPLNESEKQARVRDLLMARSGVYHQAACETPGMRDLRPARGSHPPGTFWYYNNWDFNALGAIFRQQTGGDVFEEFKRKIARRLGMQDFRPSRCSYYYQMEYSDHPCYVFRMSARDRARFGQLFLQRGRWGGRQIIPETWVDQSTRPYSDTEPSSGLPGVHYGYMWWVETPETFQLLFDDSRLHHLRAFSANGNGGQLIMVVPDAEMVIVFAVDMHAGGDMEIEETLPMLETILTSREIIDLALVRSKVKQKTVAAGDRVKLIAKSRNRSAERSHPTTIDFYLSPERRPTVLGDDLRWIGKVDLQGLAAGKRKTARLKTFLPEDLPAGRYYLVTVVDDDKTNYDLNRDNNVLLGTKAIKVE